MRRFYYNGQYNDDLNLIVTKEINIPYTNEDIDEIEVEGKSGSLTIKKGTYRDKKILIQIKLYTGTFYYDWERFIEWLDNIEDNRLIIDERDKAYIVKRINVDDVVRDLRTGGTSTMEFTCEPFLTEITEDEIDIISNDVFNYAGNIEGEPEIEIWGTGNIQLLINGEVTTFTNVNGYVKLDSKYMMCTNLDGTNFSFQGQFPLLIKGENTINFVGSVTRATMKPRTQYKN